MFNSRCPFHPLPKARFLGGGFSELGAVSLPPRFRASRWPHRPRPQCAEPEAAPGGVWGPGGRARVSGQVMRVSLGD